MRIYFPIIMCAMGSSLMGCNENRLEGTVFQFQPIEESGRQQEQFHDQDTNREDQQAREPVMVGGSYLVLCDLLAENPPKYGCVIKSKSDGQRLTNISQASAIFNQADGREPKISAFVAPAGAAWDIMLALPYDISVMTLFDLEVTTTTAAAMTIPSSNVSILRKTANAESAIQDTTPATPQATPVIPVPAPAAPTQAPAAPEQVPATPAQVPATPEQAPATPAQAPVTTLIGTFNLSFAGMTDCLTAPTLPDGQAFSITYAVRRQPCAETSKLDQVLNDDGTTSFMRGTDQCLQAMKMKAGSIYYVIASCTRQPPIASRFQLSQVTHSGQSGTSLDLPGFTTAGRTCLAHMTSPNSGAAFMHLCSENIPLTMK